jgi:oligosaccharide repeat unit polymerase
VTGPPARHAGSVWPTAVLLVALLATVVTIDESTILVVAPLMATLVCALVFVRLLTRRRRGDLLWFEIGLIYVAVVTLYTVYPLVGFLVIDQRYTPLNDLRLQVAGPDAATVGRTGWLYVAHLATFVICYLGGRGRLPISVPRPSPPRMSVGVAAIAFYLAIQGFTIVLGWFYDTSAGSYIESYLVARRLPLFVAQVAGHLQGALYPLAIVLLVLLFSRYPQSRLILITWLLATVGVTALRLGNRTDLVLFVFALAVMYHSLVRRIPVRVISIAAVAGLAAFVAFGIVRAGIAGSADQPWYVVPFASSTEFEVLFGNVVHLDQVVASGVDLQLPAYFFLGDVLAVLPQQLAPYAKFDPAAWYVHTFFPEYAAAGGGLAFGVIAESVLTGGIASAAARGAFLGLLFAGIHRLYVHHPRQLWIFVLYVWMTTLSYQAFRASTLYLLVPFVYRFVVVMLAVSITAALLDFAARTPRRFLTAVRPIA